MAFDMKALEDDDEQHKVMLVVQEDQPHTTDSVLIDAACGHRCWISPSSLTAMENDDTFVVVCGPCAGFTAHRLVEWSEKGNLHTTPAMRESFERLVGKEASDLFHKILEIREFDG